MVLLTATFSLFLTFFSEKIFVNNGFGWDGAWYGLYAIRFGDLLSGELAPVDPRVLPSALGHLILRLAGAELNEANVIVFFQLYNASLLVATCLAWCSTTNRLGGGSNRKILGFIIIFWNHAVLKYSFFYPVQMDTSSIFLSTAVLSCFLAGRTVWLLAIGAMAFFIWPVVTVFALLLWLFPKRETGGAGMSEYGGMLLGAAALAGLAGAVYVASITNRLNVLEMRQYLPLSLALTATWVYLCLKGIFARSYFGSIRTLAEDNRLGRLLPVLATLLAVFVLHASFTRLFYTNPFLHQIMDYLRNVLDNSLHRPGEFFVAATMYLGPVMLLVAANAGRSFKVCGQFGWGMALCCSLICFQLLNPITRQATAGLPFLALMAVLSLEETVLTRAFLAVFAVLSLAMSKVWMTFCVNVDPRIPGEKNLEFFTRYVSSSGRHMTREWYDIQTWIVVFLLAAFVTYFLVIGRKMSTVGVASNQSA